MMNADFRVGKYTRISGVSPTLAARAQTPRPEAVKVQHAPQVHRQPAGALLPGTTQLDLVQPHTNRFGGRYWQLLEILRKQRQLPLG